MFLHKYEGFGVIHNPTVRADKTLASTRENTDVGESINERR
jgi:hypothetical protein